MNPLFLIPVVGFFALSSNFVGPIPTEADQLTPDQSRAVGTSTAPADVRGHQTAQESYTVRLTGYNAVPDQTDSDPSETASGAWSNPEVVAARSADLVDALPFGTIVAITRDGSDTPGCQFHNVEKFIGYRVIADRMNSRYTTPHLDVLFGTKDKVSVDGIHMNPAYALGSCGKVTVRVVGHVDIGSIPKTQADLAALVEGSTKIARR